MGQQLSKTWIIALLAGLAGAAGGCRRHPAGGETVPAPPPAGGPTVLADNSQPLLKYPQVALTDTLLATCLVKMGDTLPAAELPDVAGRPQALSALLGRKVTVLFFWTAGNRYSRQEVEDLSDYATPEMAADGVAVIGINHGDNLEAIRKVATEAGVKYPMLQDPQGAYFHKLATEKVLRTYLLDAQGRVLWFDLEYSQGTQRDLLRGVNVALGKKG